MLIIALIVVVVFISFIFVFIFSGPFKRKSFTERDTARVQVVVNDFRGCVDESLGSKAVVILDFAFVGFLGDND